MSATYIYIYTHTRISHDMYVHIVFMLLERVRIFVYLGLSVIVPGKCVHFHPTVYHKRNHHHDGYCYASLAMTPWPMTMTMTFPATIPTTAWRLYDGNPCTRGHSGPS